jgi:hypothetical protein
MRSPPFNARASLGNENCLSEGMTGFRWESMTRRREMSSGPLSPSQTSLARHRRWSKSGTVGNEPVWQIRPRRGALGKLFCKWRRMGPVFEAIHQTFGAPVPRLCGRCDLGAQCFDTNLCRWFGPTRARLPLHRPTFVVIETKKIRRAGDRGAGLRAVADLAGSAMQSTVSEAI